MARGLFNRKSVKIVWSKPSKLKKKTLLNYRFSALEKDGQPLFDINNVEVFSEDPFNELVVEEVFDNDEYPALEALQTSPSILSLYDAVIEVGLPSIPDTTPEEELEVLLSLASEVEHGLMVQYLYAMYSSADPIITAVLRKIAVEEMGHLATVQNLLIMAGHQPYMGRYDWTSNNELDPMPFNLEPVSLTSLAKYTAAEAPEISHVTEEQLPYFNEIIELSTNEIGNVPFRVGLLYAKIYWLLKENDELAPNGEIWKNYPVEEVAKMFPGRHVETLPANNESSRQMPLSDWQANELTLIVKKISSRPDALEAVALISEQGEGFGSPENASHFDEFIKIFEYSKKQTQINKATPLALLVPTNPWWKNNAVAGASNRISSPAGVEFAHLADLSYEITLLLLAVYFDYSDTSHAEHRNALATNGLDAMTDALRRIGKEITNIRAGDDDEMVCGIPFGRPSSDIGNTSKERHDRLSEAISEAVNLASQIIENSDGSLKRTARRILRNSLDPAKEMVDALPIMTEFV